MGEGMTMQATSACVPVLRSHEVDAPQKVTWSTPQARPQALWGAASGTQMKKVLVTEASQKEGSSR